MAAFLKSPERRHHTYPACDMRGHARHAGYVRWRRPSNMCCCSSNKWTFTKKMTSQWIRRRNDVVSLPSINQCQLDLRLHSSIIELSGSDMSTYWRLHWPNISCREMWSGRGREGEWDPGENRQGYITEWTMVEAGGRWADYMETYGGIIINCLIWPDNNVMELKK